MVSLQFILSPCGWLLSASLHWRNALLSLCTFLFREPGNWSLWDLGKYWLWTVIFGGLSESKWSHSTYSYVLMLFRNIIFGFWFYRFFFSEVVFLLSFRKGTLVTEIPDGKRVREGLKPRKNLSCSTACQPYKVQRFWWVSLTEAVIL